MRRLLIRPGAIGDCILAFPALQHLTSDYTEVWVPSPVVPLIRFADSVRSIAETGLDLVGVGDREVPARLESRLRSFDQIVSWYGANRPEFREALLRLTSRCVFLRALPPSDYADHATDYFAEQVGAPKGAIPQIAVDSSARRNTIVIHPFSGGRGKNWPLPSYRELASLLAQPVEWTAGPEEELSSATRFTSLSDLAQWMRASRLYIGNDSGITHLAAAIGIRTLAIFGPTSPSLWAPRGKNVAVLRSEPLGLLQPETVLAAANRLLDSP